MASSTEEVVRMPLRSNLVATTISLTHHHAPPSVGQLCMSCWNHITHAMRAARNAGAPALQGVGKKKRSKLLAKKRSNLPAQSSEAEVDAEPQACIRHAQCTVHRTRTAHMWRGILYAPWATLTHLWQATKAGADQERHHREERRALRDVAREAQLGVAERRLNPSP